MTTADANRAQALEFTRQHGYPPDARRVPAGDYVLSGVDMWRDADEELHLRGETVHLDDDTATRLAHAGAIDPDDPDGTKAAVAATPDAGALLAEVETQIAGIDEQVEAYRRSAVRQAAGEIDRGKARRETLITELADVDRTLKRAKAVVEAPESLTMPELDEVRGQLVATRDMLRAQNVTAARSAR